MKIIMTIIFSLAAVNATAADKYFLTSGMGAGVSLKTTAKLYRTTREISTATTRQSNLTALVTAHSTCNDTGLVYMPAHASADASGCVDPSVWGTVTMPFTADCDPTETPPQYWQYCRVSCPTGWTATGGGQCSQQINSSPWNHYNANCTGCSWNASGTFGNMTDCNVQWFNLNTTRRLRALIWCQQ